MPLRDRFLAWRDRTIAKPGFQRWAARFPLTRRIANRRANQLFDLVAGFVYSQILYACVRVRLFEILAEEPLTAAELAPKLGLPPAATDRLIAAAKSLQLVEPRPRERIGLGRHGAVLAHNKGLTAMIEHHAMLYQDLADPVALLRGEVDETRLGAFWAYARNPDARDASPTSVADYSALMAASQGFIADEVLDAYDISRHRTLLDVGGGEGAFIEAARRRAPDLDYSLYDLPAVAERARLRLGDNPNLTFHGGDFFKDPLPKGADLITLVRVIHDHDDLAAAAILEAAGAALEPGGTLLLAEPMAGTRGAEPMGDAYFGFYLLAMGSGRPRSVPVLVAMMRQAGLTHIRLRRGPRPMLIRVLTAVKPETYKNV